jgi:diguanylate cyclase (GGDEF)-like protein/PAS domain S-box-containing protein
MVRGHAHQARRGVWAAAVVLLVVVCGAGGLIAWSQAAQRASLAARFDARQATAVRFIEAFIAEVFGRERALAGRSFPGPVTGAGFARVAADQGYAAAVLLDAAGRMLASQPANPASVGKDMTGYAHLRTAVGGAAAVSGVVPSAVLGQPVIGFAVPFPTATGRRVFSGAYAVEETPLAPFVRNATPFATARVLIVDTAGVIVTGDRTGDGGQPLTEASPRLAGVTAATSFLGNGPDAQYVTQSAVAGTPWRLIIAVDADELFAPLTGPGRWIPWLALAALTLAAVLILAVYLLARARLLESEARRRTIIDTAGDAFLGMDEHGTITEWNAAATHLLGWAATEAIGRPLADLVVPPEQRQAHLAALARFLTTGQTALPAGAVHVQALHRDGTRVDVEFTLSRLHWESRWHFHAFLRDISERLEHEAQLHTLARTDALTGLANRRAALDRLDQALARADRHAAPVSVIYIDVDLFKAINDQHGHAAGDAVLIEIAARLRATFRTEDTLARLGGDEFLVVCEDLHNRDDAQLLADRTQMALSQPYPIAGKRLDITASVGLGLSEPTSTADHLLAHADANMYDAKTTRQALATITKPLQP